MFKNDLYTKKSKIFTNRILSLYNSWPIISMSILILTLGQIPFWVPGKRDVVPKPL